MALNVGELFATIRLDTTNFTNALQKAQQDLQNANNGFNNMARAANIARVAVAGVTVALSGLAIASGAVVLAGVQLNASAEQSRISFEALLGSASRADRVIRQLVDFAKTTPFEYAGIERAAISLLNAGINASDLESTLTSLGDAVSVSGGNIQEKLDGVTFAISQMLAKGKLSSEEMNQIAERGIPIWDALAETLGKSVQETRQLVEAGKVASTVVPGLIEAMGARTQGAMVRQSQTLSGAWSTLNDTLKEFIKQITKGSFEVLRKELLALNDTLAKLEGSFSSFAFVYTLNGALTKFTESIVKFFKTIGAEIARLNPQAVDDLYNAFLEFINLITGFIASAGVASIIESIMSLITGMIDVANFLILVLTNIANFLQPIFNFLQPIFSILGKLIVFFATINFILIPLINLMIYFTRSIVFITFFTSGLTSVIAVLSSAFSALGVTILSVVSRVALFGPLLSAWTTLTGLFTGATLSAATATTAFGAAMLKAGSIFLSILGPIGLIALAITALSYVMFQNMDLWPMLGTAMKQFVTDGDLWLGFWMKFLNMLEAIYWMVISLIWGFGVLLNKIGLASDESVEFWAKEKKAIEERTKERDKQADKYMEATRKEVQAERTKNTEINKEEMMASYERAQLQRAEEARKEKIILQARAGVKSAIEDVKKMAENGSKLAIEAMAEIDSEFFTRLYNKRAEQLKSLIALINSPTSLAKRDPITFAGLGKAQQERVAELKEEVDLYEKLADEYSLDLKTGKKIKTETTITLTPGEKKQSEFEAFKEWLQMKKDLNQMSMDEEIAAWEKQRALYQGKSVEEQRIRREINVKLYQLQREKVEMYDKTEREKIDRMKSLGTIGTQEETKMLVDHYNKIKSTHGKYKDIVLEAQQAAEDARVRLVNEYLEEEYQEIRDLTNKRNEDELEAIRKHYADKRKEIQDAIDKERELYDKEDIAEKVKALEKEKAFLQDSFDKDAIARVIEIDKEMRQIKRDAKIKQMEEEAELQNASLDMQEKLAFEAQEEINKNRIKKMEEDWEIEAQAYRKRAADMVDTITTIKSDILKESDEVEKAGSNFVQKLIDGMNSKRDAFYKLTQDLADMIKSTTIGEFKDQTNVFTQVGMIDTNPKIGDVGGSNRMALNLNAPLFSADKVILGDKMDAETLGRELWNGLQSAARSNGVIIGGRI